MKIIHFAGSGQKLRRKFAQLFARFLLLLLWIHTLPSIVYCMAPCEYTKHCAISRNRGNETVTAIENCILYRQTVQCASLCNLYEQRQTFNASTEKVLKIDEHTSSNYNDHDFEDNFESSYPACEAGLARANLRLHSLRSIHQTSDGQASTADILKVNVSVSIEQDEAIEAVALRQRCVEAFQWDDAFNLQDDPICHNHSRPQWKRFYWPCRMFKQNGEGFTFASSQSLDYNCFFAGNQLSTMSIHVLLYPQVCQMAYTYRVPQLTKGSFEWMPFVFVDANYRNGTVIVHYQFVYSFAAALTAVNRAAAATAAADNGSPVTLAGDREMLRRNKQIRLEVFRLSRRTKRRGSVAVQIKERDFKVNLSNGFASEAAFHDLVTGQHLVYVRLLSSFCLQGLCPPTVVSFNVTSDKPQRLRPSSAPATKGDDQVVLLDDHDDYDNSNNAAADSSQNSSNNLSSANLSATLFASLLTFLTLVCLFAAIAAIRYATKLYNVRRTRTSNCSNIMRFDD